MRISFTAEHPLRRLLQPLRVRILIAALAVGVSLCALTLAGVGSDKGENDPRAVTSSEAQQLAMVRFKTFDGSPHNLKMKIDNGTDSYAVRGLIDYRKHRAIGAYVAGAEGGKQQKGLIAWDSSGVAVAPGKRKASSPSGVAEIMAAAAKLPGKQWSPRDYGGYPLDTVLRVVLALGADRPDNAQLLAQSGPRRLGESTLRGKSYTRFSGPRPRPQKGGKDAKQPKRPRTSPLTYWVDENGDLGRLEIKSESMKRPVTVDFLGREARTKVPGEPWGESKRPAK